MNQSFVVPPGYVSPPSSLLPPGYASTPFSVYPYGPQPPPVKGGIGTAALVVVGVLLLAVLGLLGYLVFKTNEKPAAPPPAVKGASSSTNLSAPASQSTAPADKTAKPASATDSTPAPKPAAAVSFPFPECKPGCLDQGQYQRIGTQYILPTGQCLQAKTNCLGCLEHLLGNPANRKMIEDAFVSCETDKETRFLDSDTVVFPDCKPGCLNSVYQRVGTKYVLPSGQCLKATTACWGCLESLQQNGNQPGMLRDAFSSCLPNRETRYK